jgi:hypothetical protein
MDFSSPIRDKARAYLHDIPLGPHNYIGSKSHSRRFSELTNRTHEQLRSEWNKGSFLTTCNAFTGVYGSAMGDKTGLLHSLFPETYLFSKNQDKKYFSRKIERGYAWIKSALDARPRFGDVYQIESRPVFHKVTKKFLYNSAHVGIVMDFDDEDYWFHADSGQGAPGKDPSAQDMIMKQRSRTAFDHTVVKGWVDIELFLADLPDQTKPTPKWLQGWWEVAWRGSTYYYYFFNTLDVLWSIVPPLNIAIAPLRSPMHMGRLITVGETGFLITWNDTGARETFYRVPGFDDTNIMGSWSNGKRSDSSPVEGQKISS